MTRATLDYNSEALGKMHGMVVLLPDDGEGPFEVLLLLHGLSDDETAWTRRTNLERHADGRGLMIVMPDGGRGFYADAHEGAEFGRAIGAEVPAFIRRHFRAKESGWHVAGLSMGGYGALRLGMSEPGLWATAHSFSGALSFGGRDWRADQPEFARIIGSDPQARGLDLYALADARPDVRISFDCGTEDFLLDQNRSFRDHLVAHGIPHVYAEFPGEHEWGYWDAGIVRHLDRIAPRP